MMFFLQGGRGSECLICYLFVTFSLIHGTPSRYNLFQGSAYSGPAQRHRGRNWCAHVVHKNVTCAVLGTTEGSVEPELVPCPADQPDCAPQMMYRTRFRPVYRIGHKMVTELEWRCCPGFQGPDCGELKGSASREATSVPHSHPGPSLEQVSGAGRVGQLEQEVQRLSQTVLDLQAVVAGMNENLRADPRGDASRMLVTLVNNLQSADGVRGEVVENTYTSAGGLRDVTSHAHGVSDTLKNEDGLLGDFHGSFNGQDGQYRSLRDASHIPLPSAFKTSPSLVDPDQLQAYIDRKFEELRKELMEGTDIKLAILKSSCDRNIQSVQKECAKQEGHYMTLSELLTAKEAGLKAEIRDLRFSLGDSDDQARSSGAMNPGNWPEDLAELRREVEQIAEASRALNARVDNELEHVSSLQLEDVLGPRIEELEARFNITERNTEVHCFYIDEKLTKLIAEEVAALRLLLEEKLNTMEDHFTTTLVEMSNSSFPESYGESDKALQIEVNSSKQVIQGLEQKVNALGKQCSSSCGAGPKGFDTFLEELRLCRNDIDALASDVNTNSDKLVQLDTLVQRRILINHHDSRNLADLQAGMNSLRDDVAVLQGAVGGLGESLAGQADDLQFINVTCGLAGMTPPGEAQGTLSRQVEVLQSRLDHLDNQVSTELRRCMEATEGVRKDISAADGRIADVEKVCGKLTGLPGEPQQHHKGLEERIGGLWAGVSQINSTVGRQSADLADLRGLLQDLRNQISGKNQTAADNAAGDPRDSAAQQTEDQRTGSSDILKPAADPTASQKPQSRVISRIHVPLIVPPPRMPQSPREEARAPHSPRQPEHSPQPPAIPQRPVLEVGEAGPPGASQRSPAVLEVQPLQGVAGAPGYLPLSPASFKHKIFPAAAHGPWRLEPHRSIVTRALRQSHPPATFSFSAGLGGQPRVTDLGVVCFDNILVNDGGHYDPATGTFTVPEDGRYLVSAVLMAQQGNRVEAVLTVTDQGVQRLASSTPASHLDPKQRHSCGGPASLSLLLTLHRGDTVRLVVTSGKLAKSNSNEVLSTFSAIYLYPIPVST